MLLQSHHVGPSLNNSSLPAVHNLNTLTLQNSSTVSLLHSIIFSFHFAFLLSVFFFLTFTFSAFLHSKCQPFLPLHYNIPPLQTPTFQHPNIHSHQITLIPFNSPNSQILYNYIFYTLNSLQKRQNILYMSDFILPSSSFLNTASQNSTTTPTHHSPLYTSNTFFKQTISSILILYNHQRLFLTQMHRNIFISLYAYVVANVQSLQLG